MSLGFLTRGARRGISCGLGCISTIYYCTVSGRGPVRTRPHTRRSSPPRPSWLPWAWVNIALGAAEPSDSQSNRIRIRIQAIRKDDGTSQRKQFTASYV